MELNIVSEMAALQRLSIGQLRQRFAEVFGEATAASNRTWLVKRIIWRRQALAEGDLSERARRRAAELARDADLRLNPPRNKATTPAPEPVGIAAPVDPRRPPPGTILTRPCSVENPSEDGCVGRAAASDTRFRWHERV